MLTEHPCESLRTGTFECSRLWDQCTDASILARVDSAWIWHSARWRLDKNWDRTNREHEEPSPERLSLKPVLDWRTLKDPVCSRWAQMNDFQLKHRTHTLKWLSMEQPPKKLYKNIYTKHCIGNSVHKPSGWVLFMAQNPSCRSRSKLCVREHLQGHRDDRHLLNCCCQSLDWSKVDETKAAGLWCDRHIKHIHASAPSGSLSWSPH